MFTTFIFSVVTLNGATAIVSVDTMEFGQPNKKHHFNMFALSVATATESVDTIMFVYILTTISFFMFTLSIAAATSLKLSFVTKKKNWRSEIVC